ncbi:hypothetical protein EDD11_005494 [Mortierella claussenii]|nr:hypothetical protein EDD11_005494 [Mortierella claussenii]
MTATTLFSGLVASVAHADILCTQYGSDTIRVDAIVKFLWSDTGSVAIDSFRLGLYCYENNKLMQTIATLNTTASVSPQTWKVDSTILNSLAECPLNQYQGRFDWTFADPNTGAIANGSAPCKTMLLVGPGVIPAPGSPAPDPQPVDDTPNPGDIVISDRTKTIVIGVGCAVGVLILAGIVGFYIIRYKNKRAEQDQANRKLREPLHPSHLEHANGGLDGSRGTGGAEGAGEGGGEEGVAPGAAARYHELSSVNTSIAGFAPSTHGEMVELGGMPPARGSFSHSRPQSPTRSGSYSPTPIAAQHSRLSGYTPSTLSHQPSPAFVNDRPASLLTSSFTPPEEDYSERGPANREQRRIQEEAELQRQQYEQQLHHQQQMQIQQQQQQQQQLNYGGY